MRLSEVPQRKRIEETEIYDFPPFLNSRIITQSALGLTSLLIVLDIDPTISPKRLRERKDEKALITVVEWGTVFRSVAYYVKDRGTLR